MDRGRPSYQFLRIEDHIDFKLNVLRELGIRLTKEQRDHMRSLKTSIAVDNYARSIICKGDWDA